MQFPTVFLLARFLLQHNLFPIHRKVAALEETVVSACKTSESPYIKVGFHHLNARSRKRTFTTTSPNGLLTYRRSIEKLAIFSTGKNTAQGYSMPHSLGTGVSVLFPGLQVPSMDQRRLPCPFLCLDRTISKSAARRCGINLLPNQFKTVNDKLTSILHTFLESENAI